MLKLINIIKCLLNIILLSFNKSRKTQTSIHFYELLTALYSKKPKEVESHIIVSGRKGTKEEKTEETRTI